MAHFGVMAAIEH